MRQQKCRLLVRTGYLQVEEYVFAKASRNNNRYIDVGQAAPRAAGACRTAREDEDPQSSA